MKSNKSKNDIQDDAKDKVFRSDSALDEQIDSHAKVDDATAQIKTGDSITVTNKSKNKIAEAELSNADKSKYELEENFHAEFEDEIHNINISRESKNVEHDVEDDYKSYSSDQQVESGLSKLLVESKTKNKNKKTKKIIIISLVIIAMLLAFVIIFVLSKFGKINFISDDFFKRGSANTDENKVINLEKDPDAVGKDVDEETLREINSRLARNLPDKMLFDENIFNIMLIGVDSREGNIQSNSDSMILVSLDLADKKIYLNSFLRDTYVEIPEFGYGKLNFANELGGPPLLLETIKHNFRIEVDDYALVNMFDLEDIINILGGVDIDVKDSELEHLNEIIQGYNVVLKLNHDDGKLEHSGRQVLNGKQAVCFARIRKIGNSDYERTERQRRVLMSVFNGMRGANFLQLNQLVDEIFPMITTNIGMNQIFALMKEANTIFNSKIISARVPVDGSFQETYIEGMAVLVPDLPLNIMTLAKDIYDMDEETLAKWFEVPVDTSPEEEDYTYETTIIPSETSLTIDDTSKTSHTSSVWQETRKTTKTVQNTSTTSKEGTKTSTKSSALTSSSTKRSEASSKPSTTELTSKESSSTSTNSTSKATSAATTTTASTAISSESKTKSSEVSTTIVEVPTTTVTSIEDETLVTSNSQLDNVA